MPANEVNRPKSEIKLQQREIKSSGRGAQQVQPGQAGGPERISPAKPAQPKKARSERVAPARPGQTEKPGQPVEKETEKFRGSKPAERGVEATKEGNPQEKVGPGKPKETNKPPERGVIGKQKEVKPPERAIGKQKEGKTPERNFEKPKEPRPSGKDIEKRRE